MNATKRIAVVSCSTREPRINPYVAEYIHRIVSEIASNTLVEVMDLADQSLPILDEPGIPAYHPAADPTPHYVHEHTRAWSTTVRKYDAFIFVTPQYNWSIPASLKNALDYLYHEWTRKPIGIVSYGGHGGGKATDHLRSIVTGMKMAPVEATAALITKAVTPEKCLERGGIDEAVFEMWRESGEKDNVRKMFSEVVSALA